MLVFVAGTPDFGEQSRVADAAMNCSSKYWATTDGAPVTAVGFAGLPLNSPVEIQILCTGLLSRRNSGVAVDRPPRVRR
ncbi:hypothetical protein QBA36_42660, partial [Streptomyces stelliscabiei]